MEGMPQWLQARDIWCNLHASLLLVHLIGNSIQHIGYHIIITVWL